MTGMQLIKFTDQKQAKNINVKRTIWLNCKTTILNYKMANKT